MHDDLPIIFKSVLNEMIKLNKEKETFVLRKDENQ